MENESRISLARSEESEDIHLHGIRMDGKKQMATIMYMAIAHITKRVM